MIAKNSARRLIQGGIVTNYLAAPIDKWGDLEQGAAIDVKMNFYEAFMQFRRICADYNTKTQLAMLFFLADGTCHGLLGSSLCARNVVNYRAVLYACCRVERVCMRCGILAARCSRAKFSRPLL